MVSGVQTLSQQRAVSQSLLLLVTKWLSELQASCSHFGGKEGEGPRKPSRRSSTQGGKCFLEAA